LLEDNVFAWSQTHGAPVLQEFYRVTDPSCLTTIRHNRFLANDPRATPAVGGILVTTAGGNVLIDSNLFDHCFAVSIPGGGGGANAIYVYNSGTTITHNRFTNIPSNGIAAIRRFCPARPSIHDNWFIHTNYAFRSYFEQAAGTDTIDISQNYWGDSTGPYHALFNPTGRGDTVVGNFVHIAPWLTDTLSPDTTHPDTSIADNHFFLHASAFSLSSSPNPFNPVTELSFTLPVAGRVTLTVFDLTGREVRTLVNGVFPSGWHSVSFDAHDLPSGIYFARVSTDSDAMTRKIILLK
jgi:hypothetical protein